jgi:hypothetical protein
VIFKLAPSREASIAHEFLKDYKGILISDFFAGYDNINCLQQKCWVYLIRDLNNDLWEAAFDKEFETFVLAVKNLILPIIEATHRYGLRKRHLYRFKKTVKVFYNKVIDNKSYKSEYCSLYQKRFIRYKDSLFTFIEYDDINWHNNTAELAIRHIAKQRSISGYFHENRTHDYLILLVLS